MWNVLNMRITLRINLVLLTLLSISTGVVKLMSMDEEMALFRHVGFSDAATMLFGVVQLAAGLALVHPKTRRVGAAVLIPTFVFATYALFAMGVMPFAPLSLLFVVMAALVVRFPAGIQAPGRSAGATCPRRVQPLFCKMLCTWSLTVERAMKSCPAMSRLDAPSPSSNATSRSRDESSAHQAGFAGTGAVSRTSMGWPSSSSARKSMVTEVPSFKDFCTSSKLSSDARPS